MKSPKATASRRRVRHYNLPDAAPNVRKAYDAALRSIEQKDDALRQTLQKSPGLVKVTFKVTGFEAVLSTADRSRCTKHAMVVARSPAARVEGEGDSAKIKISSRSVTLRIRVQDAAGQENYFPVGLAMLPLAQQGETNVYYQTHIYGNDLFLTIDYIKRTAVADYSFFVLIQRESDGAIGIIDPDLGHDDNPPK